MSEKLFIEKWINSIQSAEVKPFPFDYIYESQLNLFSIPKKTLVLGQEFFGAYEVITTDGEQVYQALDMDEARFFIYSSRERSGRSYLPKTKNTIREIILKYHKYLDRLIEDIRKDYKISFPDGKNVLSVTTEIFQKLNLIRY